MIFDTNTEGTQNMVAINANVSETGAVATVKKGNKVIGSSNDQGVVSIAAVAIDEGDDTITVEVLPPSFVTAQKKTYRLTINRARQNASDDARLRSLSPTGATLMPAFNASDLPVDDDDSTVDGATPAAAHKYTARVTNSVESLTVIAGAMNSRAMVSITYGVDNTPVSGGVVDLIVGPNVINIAVTAEDRLTASMKHYQVTVSRAAVSASTDATLSELTVIPGMPQSPTTGTPAMTTLDTKFEYSIDYAYDFDTNTDGTQNMVAIAATASETDPSAVVTVKKGNKVIGSSNDQGVVSIAAVAIDEGDNTITVEVLPPSFVAAQKKTYTLTINRAARSASDDARLSSLSLSHGMLMPAFNASALPTGENAAANGTTEALAHPYKARVPNSVESLTVMAEAMSSGAMVSITSAQDTSVSGGAVDLTVGDNVIRIQVTAENNSTKYYQATVTRVAATASSNAALNDLILAMPTVTLDPAFDTANLPALMAGAHNFSASASRGSGSIRVVPTMADEAGATVTVTSSTTDGVISPVDPNADQQSYYEVDLEVGDNVITVMVMAADVMTTKTYKITINRAGTGNTALSDLSLSGLTLNEPFGTAAEDAYTADAASSIDSTTVTATPEQSNATVDIMPRDADPAMDGHQVALTPGSNTIIVTVTAGDNTRDYTVTVTAEASSDATLESLTLSDLTLSPAFDPATTAYTAEVETLDMTTVVAMATDPGATVEGTGDKVLTVGAHTFEVTVTAEDGETSQIYTVTVTVLMGSTLLDIYDTNTNDQIDKNEVVQAIRDYLEDEITKADVVRVITLYFTTTG